MVGCNTAHVQREFIIARSIFDRIFGDPASSEDSSTTLVSHTVSQSETVRYVEVTMLGSVEVKHSLYKNSYFVCYSPALHVFVVHDHGHGRAG